jgi:hypothetical protein
MTERLEAFRQEMFGWRGDLMLTPTKQPKPLLANVLIALRRAPEWQGVLAYDEFGLATMAMKPPPWLKGQDNSWTLQQWTDRDDVLTTDWLQHQGIGITVTVAANAVETVAKDASFHPVRNYLRQLTWDGTHRVASFAEKYLGAEPTDYHRNVSRCMFIAAVARIMRPVASTTTYRSLRHRRAEVSRKLLQRCLPPGSRTTSPNLAARMHPCKCAPHGASR